MKLPNFERDHHEKVVRTLKDMAASFKDAAAVSGILKKKNPVLYEVFISNITSTLAFGLTVIQPGAVGKEFYMTQGHIHIRASPEVYSLLEGSGKLVIQKGIAGAARIVSLKKDRIFIVPEGYAHRLVNVGKKKLKVLTLYESDTGHNYKMQFRKRIFRK